MVRQRHVLLSWRFSRVQDESVPIGNRIHSSCGIYKLEGAWVRVRRELVRYMLPFLTCWHIGEV